jgi:ABC-type dipeptide/oligopeptide/nickel transport system permease component
LLHILPGSAWDDEYNINPVIKADLEKNYGWQRGSLSATKMFLENLVQGKFGPCLMSPGHDARSVIMDAWSMTLRFAVPALLISLLTSLIIAVATMATKFESYWNFISDFILSVPSIVMFPIVILIFAQIHNFPTTYDGTILSMLLPIFFLTLKPVIHLSNVLLKASHTIQSQDYIRTARALGFSNNKIKWKWLLKNAILPYVAYLPPLLVSITSGSLFLEIIFNIQGMHLLLINSLLNRDYFVLVGLILIFGLILSAAQLLVDILTQQLDPRISK